MDAWGYRINGYNAVAVPREKIFVYQDCCWCLPVDAWEWSGSELGL